MIREALRAARPSRSCGGVIESAPGPDGIKTVLDRQSVGATRYFDAAGFPGRTVGLSAH